MIKFQKALINKLVNFFVYNCDEGGYYEILYNYNKTLDVMIYRAQVLIKNFNRLNK